MEKICDITGNGTGEGIARIEYFQQISIKGRDGRGEKREEMLRFLIQRGKKCGKKGEENAVEKYIKFAGVKNIFFISHKKEQTETSRKFCRDVSV